MPSITLFYALYNSNEAGVAMGKDKVAVIVFDAIWHEGLPYIVHLHCEVYKGDEQVADFGTWINPEVPLSEKLADVKVLASAFAPLPPLSAVWPLVFRQIHDAYVVGKGLVLFQACLAHQAGVTDFPFDTYGDGWDLRIAPFSRRPQLSCDAFLEIANGDSVKIFREPEPRATPSPDLVKDGALYIPIWAPKENCLLDTESATLEDLVWASISCGKPLLSEEDLLQKCVFMLFSWAQMNGGWTQKHCNHIAHQLNGVSKESTMIPPSEHSWIDSGDAWDSVTAVDRAAVHPYESFVLKRLALVQLGTPAVLQKLQ